MESITSAGVRMEKLNDNNFHSWKQKIELVLGHREVDEMIDHQLCPNKPDEGTEELQKWLRKDKTARMTIGLTLCDEMLKNVAHTATALEMWDEICNVHQRHTLLNKLSARRDFYTATMHPGEKMLVYINRIRQMASILQSMNVAIDDKEMAMAVLNGLPAHYGTIITALDAIGDEDDSFTFEKVRSRLLQEEKRRTSRTSLSSSSRPSALVQQASQDRSGPNQKNCLHCGRNNHSEAYCWQKHGHPRSFARRNSRRAPRRKTTAAVVEEQPQASEEYELDLNLVCLLSKAPPQKHVDCSLLWHVDSGASNHMTFARHAFTSYRAVDPFPVQMGDKSTTMVVGRGDVCIPLKFNHSKRTCKLTNVFHVPSLAFSLISVSSLAKKGICTKFNITSVHILKDEKLLATGTRLGGLYCLDSVSAVQTPAACVASLQLWHERMGHVHHAGLQQMARKRIVKGLEIRPSGGDSPACEGCVMGKMPRTAIPKESASRAEGILDLVHTDIAGPLPVMSKGGARYFVTFIDDMSRWTTAYPIRTKCECFSYFKRFQRSAERLTGRKIKALRSDGGGEYTSNEFKDYLEQSGIAQQLTVPYTPQQNGVAERMNRTLKDLTRAMMLHKDVPQEFWGDALVTAVYIRNRVTSRNLPLNKTPYSLWHGRKPDVSHMRVFGCRCWYKINSPHQPSLNSRSSEALMIGYASNYKGYKLWDENKGEVVVSRDVKFEENPSTDAIIPKIDVLQQGGEPNNDFSSDHVPKSDRELQGDSNSFLDNDLDNQSQESIPAIDHSIEDPLSSNIPSSVGPRRSTRIRKNPGEWWNTTALLTSSADVPLSFSTATKGEDSKHWLPAIQSEIESIRKNNTWVLVPRTEAQNILTSKWVFRRKDAIDENGLPYFKYKARVVTRGFQQKEGVDYAETFAPVVKFTTLRIFFALVASLDLHCHQMDVKTAFLNGDIDQDVYMEQPQGFKDPKLDNHVCKLKKALYGLKQAPRQWFAKIDSFLVAELRFESSAYDPCLYVRKDSTSLTLLSLYVDDLLLACNELRVLVSLKKDFCKRFEMTDCGDASVCLGLEIRRVRGKKTLHLSQTAYTAKILQRFGMKNCKPVVTPMEGQLTQADLEGEPMDTALYRQCIGSLMYLSVGSRPDISFAVARLAQQVEAPTQPLWTAAKRILRYLAGTKDVGILYDGKCSLSPVGYSDSDWGGCKINRKSTSGYAFLTAGGAVSWKSKKQGCVAQSSAEAEYMALAAAAKEAIWLRRIFQFAQTKNYSVPVTIFADNQGAIKMSRNDSSGTRTKHIDIQYHFVRDGHAKNLFNIEFCSTSEMTADILTKPLARILIQKHKKSLGLESLKNIDGMRLRGSVEE